MLLFLQMQFVSPEAMERSLIRMKCAEVSDWSSLVPGDA
ncbi:unnamed protein product [Rhodiola kirilowii]